jgi:hypothetical protein
MIILLNGPPGCGKDTIAKIIRKKIGSKDYKISKPLKDAFSSLFGIQGELLHELLEERKDEPFWGESEYTPRDVQIYLYEEFLKPKFGDNCLGLITVNNIAKIAWKHLTISDCGKNSEVSPITKAYGCDKVKTILIVRPDYKWDSRERLDCLRLGIEGEALVNKWDLDLLDVQVNRILAKWGLVDEGS